MPPPSAAPFSLLPPEYNEELITQQPGASPPPSPLQTKALSKGPHCCDCCEKSPSGKKGTVSSLFPFLYVYCIDSLRGKRSVFTRSMPKTTAPKVEEKEGKKEMTLLVSVSYGDWRVRSNKESQKRKKDVGLKSLQANNASSIAKKW